MKTSPRRAAVITASLLALFLGGCASPMVNVNAITRVSIGRPRTAPGSYRLQTAGTLGPEDRLRVIEATQQIRTALSAHGLWEAPATVPPDLVVDVAFGMDTRVVEKERKRPIFGPVTDGGEQMIGRQLVGYEMIKEAQTVYEKHLSVSCRENTAPAGQPAGDLWRVTASVEDRSRDLRAYLPILASAVMGRIDEATDGVVADRPSADAIAFVKQGQ